MDAIKVCDLFDLTHTRAAKMLAACEYPWEALSKIGETVLAIGQGLDLSDYDHPAENVWIAKTATVAATASIASISSMEVNMPSPVVAYLLKIIWPDCSPPTQ